MVVHQDDGGRRKLERAAHRLGLSTAAVLVGPTAAPERTLGDVDIFALSSDTEQMPLSILEAMAAGLPIVATDVGDVRAMVADDNLPFIVPRDAARMAEAMRRPSGDQVIASPDVGSG